MEWSLEVTWHHLAAGSGECLDFNILESLESLEFLQLCTWIMFEYLGGFHRGIPLWMVYNGKYHKNG